MNWSYETLEGKIIRVTTAKRRPLVASILWIVALLMVVSSFYGGDILQRAGMVGAGMGCLTLAARMTTTSIDNILKSDSNNIILYLRSHKSDTPLKVGNVIETVLGIGQTIEQRLCSMFADIGPPVAIGRPGEKIPLLGACRMYSAHEDWQCVAQDLMRRSRLTIWRAGEEGEGLRWELRTAVPVLRPEQLLLYLPFPGRKAGARQALYEEFRSWAGPLFPCPLPEHIFDAKFIYFSGDWAAHLLFPRFCERALDDDPVILEDEQISKIKLCKYFDNSEFYSDKCDCLFDPESQFVLHPLKNELVNLAYIPQLAYL